MSGCDVFDRALRISDILIVTFGSILGASTTLIIRELYRKYRRGRG